MRARQALLLAIPLFGACDPGGGTTAAVVVADSAGVQIVSSDESVWGVEGGWTLERSPRTQIGVFEGDRAYQFNRIIGAVTLSDGRIAVADMGSSEVRLFDESGRHFASIGGAGDGPGEFRQITALHRLAEDELAVENRSHRVQIFGADGSLRRAVTIGTISSELDPILFHENPPASVRVVGWLHDGSFVGWRSTQPTLTETRTFEQAETLQHTYSRFGPQGEDVEEVLSLPGTTFHPHPMGVILSSVFASSLYTGISGDHLVIGGSGSGEVKWYSLAGGLQRVARLPWPRRPVSDDMVERYVTGSAPPLNEALVRGRTFEQSLPAFSDLMVDPLGNVWLRRYEVDHAFTTMQYVRTVGVPSEWVVLDPAGRWLGEVQTPAQFTVLEIGSDHVLGLRRDEFDVEFIEVYRLLKP